MALLSLIALAATTVWVLSHAIPRRQTFIERRGTVVAADLTSASREAGGFVTDTMRITASTGLTVDLRVLRPSRVDAPLPVVVLLAGHRTGRDAVDLLGDPRGIVVVALDYPYHGPERIRGVAQSIHAVPLIQRGLLDTPPAVSVAVDWLLTQPWADSARLELMGVSLGVPFASVAGALDERFRRVWLIHGGADNRSWLANRLERKVSNPLLREFAATILHLLAFGPSFDTARWAAQIAPRSLVIVGASDDEQLPREHVIQLYDAARDPKDLLWTRGQHIRPSRPEIVQDVLSIVRSRIHVERLEPTDP